MKKIGLIFKETAEDRLEQSLQGASSVFIVKYDGVASSDMSNLRMSLKDSKSGMFVVKNSVARRALRDSGREALVSNIEGPCGIVLIKEDPVEISKLLCDFIKDHAQLRIESGLLEDRLLNTNDIEELSKLPSKPELRAKVVVCLKSPITGVVAVLSNTLKKFVYCLEQIKQKKGETK